MLSFAAVRAAGIKAESGSASTRPISDFLQAQGSTSFFVPPLPDLIAFILGTADPAQQLTAVLTNASGATGAALQLGPHQGTLPLIWSELR